MFSDMWSALESYAAAIVVAVVAVAAVLKSETVMEFAAFAGLAFAAAVSVKALQTMKYMETRWRPGKFGCSRLNGRIGFAPVIPPAAPTAGETIPAPTAPW
jgi:hypothetical protein